MTPKQEYLRKSLLAKIHQTQHCKILKENDDWANWLKESYGVDSSSKLSIDELTNLLDVIQKGAKPIIKGYRPKGYEAVTENQLGKIKALWAQNSRTNSESALRDFIYRTVSVRPLRLEILTRTEATKIINGINRL